MRFRPKVLIVETPIDWRNMFITGLPPIISESSRILILGSIPGPESLRRQQYYAGPGNRFWWIMGQLFHDPDLPQQAYAERVVFLHEHGIALWDVLENCIRPGGADSAIKSPAANDFSSLLKQYPNIKKLFFNGQKAWNEFPANKGLEPFWLPTEPLPSTSGSNQFHYPNDRLLLAWNPLAEALSP